MGSMHLHGGYGNANIVGNLLVYATGRDLDHYLTLAAAERAETLSKRTPRNGLVRNSIAPPFIACTLIGTSARCHKNDRDLPIRHGQLALKLESTPAPYLTSSTRQLGPSVGSALRKSETDVVCEGARQDELKYGAARFVGTCPQSPPQWASMIDRQIDSPMPGAADDTFAIFP
jgi:hypothetical protein